MAEAKKKTLGQAIDEIVAALEPLDAAARITAVRAACDQMQVPVMHAISRDHGGEGLERPVDPDAANKALRSAGQPKDIRSLKEQKAPGSAIEMAALVAYYLKVLATPDDQKEDITAKDLEKYFVQAGYRLPKVTAQVLVDAKDAGYLDKAAKGVYRLNAVGHNLVTHSLPRGSKGKS